jgi:hypothetical protein
MPRPRPKLTAYKTVPSHGRKRPLKKPMKKRCFKLGSKLFTIMFTILAELTIIAMALREIRRY